MTSDSFHALVLGAGPEGPGTAQELAGAIEVLQGTIYQFPTFGEAIVTAVGRPEA